MASSLYETKLIGILCTSWGVPTTDDVALVILLFVSYIQQQVRTVRVACVCFPMTGHRRQNDFLIFLVQVQFSHTTYNTVGVAVIVSVNGQWHSNTLDIMPCHTSR